MQNLDELFDQIQTEVDETERFDSWSPDPGHYECLLSKWIEGSQTAEDGEIWPTFRIHFKILNAEEQGQEKDEFTRFIGTSPNQKGRNFRFLELEDIVKAATGKKMKIKKAVPKLKELCDTQSTIINIKVTQGKKYTDKYSGEDRYYSNFKFSSAKVE